MDEAQTATLYNHSSAPEGLTTDAGICLEHAEHLPVPKLPQEYSHHIAHCDLLSYPSHQTLKSYFTEQCGRLGTFILNFDSSAFITSLGLRMVKLFKRVSKSIIQTLQSTSLLSNAAQFLARMKNGWRKQPFTHSRQLEVSNNDMVQGKEESPDQSWCKGLKELMVVGHALYCKQDESAKEKDYEFKVTGQSVHTFILETSFDRLSAPNGQISTKTRPSAAEASRRWQKNWSEFLTTTLLNKLKHQFLDCEYIYITQKDIYEYRKNNEPLPTQEEYKQMLDNFQAQNQECCRLGINCSLVMDITDDSLVPDCQRFCDEMNLKWTHYTWKGNEYDDVFATLCVFDEVFKKDKDKRQPTQTDLEKTKAEAKESLSGFIKLLFERMDEIVRTSKCVSSQTIHNTKNKEKTCLNITQTLQYGTNTPLLTKEETKQAKASSVYQDNLYEDNEKKIRDSQKRLNQLRCWKELMVQCKFRCRLGYKCPCGYNKQQLEIEERYMRRLIRYRNYLLQNPQPAQLQMAATAQPQRLALTAATTIATYTPTPIASITDNPLQPVANEQYLPTEAKDKALVQQKEQNQNRVKKDYISMKIAKKGDKPQQRLKRGLKDYSDQELNLMNMLNQMELEEAYRAPCYVDEERVGSWKKMGEIYRKDTKKNFESR